MKISFIVVCVLIAGFAAAFAMNSFSESELKLRYKITINVQTPDGIKSGSAVREVTIDKFQGFNPDKADFNAKMRGEAVVIDLEERGKLFALINTNSYTEMLYAFPIEEKTAPLSLEGIEYYKNLKVGDKAELKNKIHWPKFVTFEDLNDPLSVKLAREIGLEKEGSKNLEEVFGNEIFIKDIVIEITDEVITKNMEFYLPWHEEYKNKKARLNGNTSTVIFTNELADNLGTGAFSIGEEK